LKELTVANTFSPKIILELLHSLDTAVVGVVIFENKSSNSRNGAVKDCPSVTSEIYIKSKHGFVLFFKPQESNSVDEY
jgi:hypothetical protein